MISLFVRSMLTIFPKAPGASFLRFGLMVIRAVAGHYHDSSPLLFLTVRGFSCYLPVSRLRNESVRTYVLNHELANQISRLSVCKMFRCDS
jgi:hypothetical protein